MISRWGLARAVLAALSYLSVTITLATIPGRAMDYWFLYYSPVIIAALSFGLMGALVGSAATALSMVSFSFRLESLAQSIGVALSGRLGGQQSAFAEQLDQAFSEIASNAPLITVNNAAVRFQSVQDSIVTSVFGILLILGVSGLVGWLVDEHRRRDETYRVLAKTDALTGLANYLRLTESLQDEIARGRRYSHQFAFLMVDVDELKYVNDRYGHLVGDAVLKEVGRLLRAQVRDVDTVARYGGDEFGVVLVETDANGAKIAAERLRQAIEDDAIVVPGVEGGITVSIGGAVYPRNGQTMEQLIEAADTALYEGKRGGKNIVNLAAV